MKIKNIQPLWRLADIHQTWQLRYIAYIIANFDAFAIGKPHIYELGEQLTFHSQASTKILNIA